MARCEPRPCVWCGEAPCPDDCEQTLAILWEVVEDDDEWELIDEEDD